MNHDKVLTWMMWGEEKKDIAPEASLQSALEYFQKKYGQVANRLQAPLDWPEVPAPGLQVERKRFVEPNCLHLAFDPDLVQEEVEHV